VEIAIASIDYGFYAQLLKPHGDQVRAGSQGQGASGDVSGKGGKKKFFSVIR